MFIQKNNIFIDLTKNQKASLLSYIKNFVKKHEEKSVDEILKLYVEEETYYSDVGNPHFEWILDLFEKDSFLKELKYLIKQHKDILHQKEKQKPFLEKQKKFLKEERQKAQAFKMSKEKPTKKQLSYYKSLCEKYKLAKAETENLSKLDLKNLIAKIIEDNESKVFKCLEEI